MRNNNTLPVQHPGVPAESMQQRGRFVWVCTLGLGILYLGFLMLVAFQPEWLGATIAEVSSVLLWGLGLLLLLLTFVLATLHFSHASRDYADLKFPDPPLAHPGGDDVAAAEVCQPDTGCLRRLPG